MDSGIEPFHTPTITAKRIPFSSAAGFPAHDHTARIATAQVHHHGTPLPTQTQSAPEINLFSKISPPATPPPVEVSLQPEQITLTYTSSAPDLTLQGTDISPFLTSHPHTSTSPCISVKWKYKWQHDYTCRRKFHPHTLTTKSQTPVTAFKGRPDSTWTNKFTDAAATKKHTRPQKNN